MDCSKAFWKTPPTANARVRLLAAWMEVWRVAQTDGTPDSDSAGKSDCIVAAKKVPQKVYEMAAWKEH
jgi:hypothetical protein